MAKTPNPNLPFDKLCNNDSQEVLPYVIDQCTFTGAPIIVRYIRLTLVGLICYTTAYAYAIKILNFSYCFLGLNNYFGVIIYFIGTVHCLVVLFERGAPT